MFKQGVWPVFIGNIFSVCLRNTLSLICILEDLFTWKAHNVVTEYSHFAGSPCQQRTADNDLCDLWQLSLCPSQDLIVSRLCTAKRSPKCLIRISLLPLPSHSHAPPHRSPVSPTLTLCIMCRTKDWRGWNSFLFLGSLCRFSKSVFLFFQATVFPSAKVFFSSSCDCGCLPLWFTHPGAAESLCFQTPHFFSSSL